MIAGEFLGYFILMQLGNGGEVNIFLQQLLAAGQSLLKHIITLPALQ